MKYYLGKGTEFKKEECKEYKTIKGALEAAAKDESLVVWDENGAEQSGDNAGASTEGENENGGGNTQPTQENGQKGQENGSDDEQQDKDEVIIPQGTMKVTVVCDGALNLRRSAAWGNDNICGRATRGQSYYVKEIHTIDGKKMVRTIDDLYLSGASEHVQFEQL